jgi:hypothetical protein
MVWGGGTQHERRLLFTAKNLAAREAAPPAGGQKAREGAKPDGGDAMRSRAAPALAQAGLGARHRRSPGRAAGTR